MGIEIGKPYKSKDDEIVLVLSNIEHDIKYLSQKYKTVFCVGFLKKYNEKVQFMEQEDFLEQYKPYEPVYEYRHCLNYHNGFIDGEYKTDEEAKSYKEVYQRLDFTKRERKS